MADDETRHQEKRVKPMVGMGHQDLRVFCWRVFEHD